MAYHYLSLSSPFQTFFQNKPQKSPNFKNPKTLIISNISNQDSVFKKSQNKSQKSPKKLLISKISLQEPILENTHFNSPTSLQYPEPDFIKAENKPQKAQNKPEKSYIWVNPKSPKASQHRKKSYDSRYTNLVKVAELVDFCESNENDVFNILIKLGDKLFEQDAVVLLNNMSNSKNAMFVLRYFQIKLKLNKEVIIYNVTLKVFRKSKDLVGAENVFDEMIKRGVKPDNYTFSTIISCARLLNLHEKAVEWYEKMNSYDCEPDGINHVVMIDSYGRLGNVEMALSLYDRARSEKWRVDVVTFSTLIKIYGKTGNFDGCLNVYEEMKALNVEPNLVVYNTLLDAMGRAKRPWQAKSVYNEMISKGFVPNWATYAALLRAYGKARYGEDGMNVYKEMKEKGLELNVTLYNTILAMCADVGYIEEAIGIFEDMKRCRTCKPDSWTFSSLITIYSCSGKVAEAEAALNEMFEAGFHPNLFVLTSLIQCYGKANQTDDVIRMFDKLVELGIAPDDRFCGCLLNVMTQTPKEKLGKLADCIEKANSKLGYVVKLIVKGEDVETETFKIHAHELFNSISFDVKKAYCNCLIDLCVNLDMLVRACELLESGLVLDIYTDIQAKSTTTWSLHLKSLSLGAALTALHVWMNDLSKALENGEELPALLGINTGHGKHKYSDKGLQGVFESHLKELNAPFHESTDKPGWFFTTNVAAKSWLESKTWLESRKSHELVAG